MYYNFGIVTAERQTKLKLQFIIQRVCPCGSEMKCFPMTSLTPLFQDNLGKPAPEWLNQSGF